MEKIGKLEKLRSGRWVVEYKEGLWPIFYTTLFPLAPWLAIDESEVTELNSIVAFRPVLVFGQLHADIE